jgi:DNA polymerase/3'-5' exonuclease PolX
MTYLTPNTNDLRLPRAQAASIGRGVVARLQDRCEHIEIAGSVRRKVPSVKDVEIVACPRGDVRQLLARLDTLVADPHSGVEKAVYVDKNGRTSHRWGPRYRGLAVRGVKVEVFITDRHSYGYQLWLRTGPGNANHYVMTHLVPSRVRFADGCVYVDGDRVSVPDERTFFQLMRFPLIPPEDRHESLYRRIGGRLEGRQMVIPPRVHPDTEAQRWQQGGLL